VNSPVQYQAINANNVTIPILANSIVTHRTHLSYHNRYHSFARESVQIADTAKQFQIVFLSERISVRYLHIYPHFTVSSFTMSLTMHGYYYGADFFRLLQTPTALLALSNVRLPEDLTRLPCILIQMLPMPKHLCSVPLRLPCSYRSLLSAGWNRVAPLNEGSPPEHATSA
jgi:hypothetical protein